MQHRFYGKSIPFGLPREEVLKNATLRGYFNSAQALADHAEIILHLKKNLSAEASPVIVCGGSYGGSESFLYIFADIESHLIITTSYLNLMITS